MPATTNSTTVPHTLALFMLTVASAATPSQADTHIVQAFAVSFEPAAITVAPGDTVTWQYASGYPHTVTSGSDCLPDGLFDAPLNGSNPTFSWTVPDDATGSVPYFCQPHCAMGMSGVITVEAGPSTIHVPGDYPTVQEAVSVAEPGDTVLIAAGSYDVDEVLYLEGVSLMGTTDAEGAPAVTLHFVDWHPASHNWGLMCTPGGDGDEIQVQDIRVLNAVVSIEIQNCSPTVTNCVFQGGEGHPQSYDSGGAQIRDSAATFIGCSFIGNSGRFGGALQAYNPAVADPITLTDCVFESNHATEDGGAFSLHTSVVSLYGCSIVGNTASGSGGGMDIHSSCTVELASTTVCGNAPDQIAGDWVDNGGNAVSDACDISSVINVPADYPTIQGAIDASSDGDTILIAAGTYLEFNIDVSGKAITIKGELGEDGVPLTIIDGQGTATQPLMGCYSGEGLDTIIENLHFTGGNGHYGGGLFFYDHSSGTVNNCLFTDNYSYMIGGATTAYFFCSPQYNNCTFRNNEAGRFGGAVLSTYDCYPVFTDCVFEGNHAAKGGGGIASYQTTTYIGCTITGNTTAGGGGGIYTGVYLEHLTDTTVCGNVPTQIGGSWTDNGGNIVADECPGDCPGDLNGSGSVDVDDLLMLLSAYSQSDAGDCDGDGDTDVEDLLVLIGGWGACP
ncbi:MAG: plastocyanin/azurin family copper-binding protein [Phycisphaerales bacterium]|nr:plastocyanin/azurin family copper-binding protein [Phycisphaerales bacterium]